MNFVSMYVNFSMFLTNKVMLARPFFIVVIFDPREWFWQKSAIGCTALQCLQCFGYLGDNMCKAIEI